MTTTAHSLIQLSANALSQCAEYASRTIAQDDVSKRAEEPIRSQNFEQIFDVLASSVEQVIEKGQHKDAEAFCAIVAHLLSKVGEPQRAQKTENFVKLVAAGSSRPALRISVLKKVLMTQAKQFHVLDVTLAFAQQHKLYDEIERLVSSIDAICVDWGLTMVQRRQLLVRIADIFADAGKRNEHISTLVRYLGALDSADQAKDEQNLVIAAKLVAAAIGHPCFFSFDEIAEIPVVQQLKTSTPVHGKLFELLELLINRSHAEFAKFSEANQQVFTANGLTSDNVLGKLRFMLLCSSLVEAAEIGFATIAEKVGVPENEVEKLIIRAVGLKLIVVRIDQVKRTVFVIKTTHLQISTEEWKQLGVRLGVWKENVNSILSKLKQNK